MSWLKIAAGKGVALGVFGLGVHYMNGQGVARDPVMAMRLYLDAFIPLDEPFDPAAFDSIGNGRRFPYWLSAPATQSFHAFFKTLDPAGPHGWSSFTGQTEDQTWARLSCLYFNDQVLWSKTAVRRQDLIFPLHDLLDEIDGCELGERLKAFHSGRSRASTKAEFKQVFDRFCDRYEAHPSHSSGAFPFEISWSGVGRVRYR